METRAIFIDKDGTLVNDVPYNVDPERVELTSKAVEGLQLFTRLGFRLVVVSNQPGVALGYFDENALGKVWQRLDQLLRPEGVPWYWTVRAVLPPASSGWRRQEIRPGLWLPQTIARDAAARCLRAWP